MLPNALRISKINSRSKTTALFAEVNLNYDCVALFLASQSAMRLSTMLVLRVVAKPRLATAPATISKIRIPNLRAEEFARLALRAAPLHAAVNVTDRTSLATRLVRELLPHHCLLQRHVHGFNLDFCAAQDQDLSVPTQGNGEAWRREVIGSLCENRVPIAAFGCEHFDVDGDLTADVLAGEDRVRHGDICFGTECTPQRVT